MGIFADTQTFRTIMVDLFDQVCQGNAAETQSLHKSKMIVSFNCSDPGLRITIDGRKAPLMVSFDDKRLRPDLEAELSADTLHYILTGELRLGKAMSSGQMKVRGAVWKAVTLEDVLHACQAKYPVIVTKYRLDGYARPS